jgi:flagellar hook-associated protein 1
MSISQALSNSMTGLGANGRMAEVISANIANALTEGYGRRSVDLQARPLTGGVQVIGIARQADPALLTDRRDADGALARDGARAGALARLEQLFSGEGAAGSIAGRLTALDQSLISAAADPASDSRLNTVLQRLGQVTDALAAGERGIQDLRQDADAAIANQVGRLNSALQGVETLNEQIARARATGSDPNAMIDQRQALIDDIATIVPLREMPRDDGRVLLYTRSGQMLLDRRAATFGFTPSPVITADMTLAGGTLNGLTLNGQPLTPAGAGRLTGGSLQAAFDQRDQTLVTAQTDLDALAADLIRRFETPAADPTRGPGAPGLLTDGGAPFDPLDPVGLAGRLSVNALADPTRGGALFRLRDGIGATAPGPTGRATQIENWLSALDRPVALGTGGPGRSAAGHAADFAAGLGLSRVSAEEAQGFAAARQTALKDRELAQGVDSDQEMQRLLLVEQAYAANARVIQTVDGLMQLLLEM